MFIISKSKTVALINNYSRGNKRLAPQFLSSTRSDLLEIFINIFSTEFIELFRKKLFRQYEQVEENMQFIKGKALFSDTIRKNLILKHLHFVRYDEFTINTPVNQIFKSVIIQLLKHTRNKENKNMLGIALTFLQDVDLIQLHPKTFERIKFNRLNDDFSPLFNLAKLFFFNRQPGLNEGNNKTFSFLVPMHLLFENYVAKILSQLYIDEIKFNYHSPRLYLAKEGIKDEFLLEPDFVMTGGGKALSILDTKYKCSLNSAGQVNLSISDMYQLTTYSVRYNCRELVLIYPMFLGSRITDSVIAKFEIQFQSAK